MDYLQGNTANSHKSLRERDRDIDDSEAGQAEVTMRGRLITLQRGRDKTVVCGG